MYMSRFGLKTSCQSTSQAREILSAARQFKHDDWQQAGWQVDWRVSQLPGVGHLSFFF